MGQVKVLVMILVVGELDSPMQVKALVMILVVEKLDFLVLLLVLVTQEFGF